MKQRHSRHATVVFLVFFAMAAGVLALAVLALLPGMGEGRAAPAWLVGAVAVGAWAGLIALHEGARGHLGDLRLVRAGMEAVATGQLLPEAVARRFDGQLGTVATMARLVGDFAAARHRTAARPDERLAAVLNALHDGVVVVTESGLISLINGPAKAVLGGGAGVGGSIYATLDRYSLVAAIYRAQRSGGRPVEAGLHTLEGHPLAVRVVDFGEHRGAVITMAGTEAAVAGEVEFALDLHDQPPPAPTPVDDTLLSELPTLVLDTETTGLDAERDAIISVGAVRCHGTRIFRSTVLDRLIDPARKIPARSTAVHGIDDAMVMDKPRIGAILPEVMAMMSGTVVVGHNIAFDLTMLRRAAAAAGSAWAVPPRLDIRLLANALDPEETAQEIDDQAARLGINISGRHTALGDSLVTAELWVRIIHQLERHGVRTLGEARSFSRLARRAMAQQRELGWDMDTEGV